MMKPVTHVPVRVDPGSILGLSYSGGHDSSVAVVASTGEITFAAALERVTRYKQDGRFPQQLLESLDLAGISACALPYYSPDDIPDGPQGQRFHAVAHGRPDYPHLRFPAGFYEQLGALPAPPVFVGHHVAHAASAFYLSGFAEATILTYDAGMYNCPWFGGVFGAGSGGLKPIEFFPADTNSKIPSLYAIVTGLLGFTPLKHEGKVTGLAAFGKPNSKCTRVLLDLLTTKYDQLEQAGQWINEFDSGRLPQFVMNEAKRSALRQLFDGESAANIAASLQQITEEHVLEVVKSVKEKAQSRALCLAGGLFANVKLNQRIHNLWCGDIFVAPPMADDGTALGAALFVAHSKDEYRPDKHRPHMYLGFEFARQDIQAALKEEGIVYSEPEDPPEVIAALLASGKTVALFDGAMEFGPRALGHRSILAAATDPKLNTWLNEKLRRTEFMPFAPITRIEDADLEYRGVAGACRAAEFMTVTFEVTDHMRRTCPAAVHVDGTARPQLVTSESAPFLHSILTAYHARTGISSVINTSFNVHEEPIVCNPIEALEAFFASQLDYLYFDGCLVSFDENQAASSKFLERRLRKPSLKEQAQRELVDYLWNVNLMLETEAQRRSDRWDEIEPLYKSAKENAEAAAEARLLVIEAQQKAIESYQRRHPIQVIKTKSAPKLGLFYQYPPRPLYVPAQYRRVQPPVSPPTISIVTPSLNQGRFLERTIRSVLDQRYPALEYVVQDGGSTDETVRILDEYAKDLCHVESHKDSGFGQALNLGFRHTTGEIMAYLNSDDILLSGALPYAARFFAAHPDVDVIYGLRVVIDEYDQEVGRWILPSHDDEVLSWADYVPQETLFWRRSLWERSGGQIDESFRFAIDWDLLLRFRDAGAKFIRVPRFLGGFRVHPHQKTSSQMESIGQEEMRRLRERSVGRPVGQAEAARRVRPYLLRHVALRGAYRLGLVRF